MNEENREQKSLYEFCRRHRIVSGLAIHGVPDQKIPEYLARIPKSDTEQARKMILREEPMLNQDQIRYRLALLFCEKINAMHDEQWRKYKKLLDNSIPSYLVLQKASDLVLGYSHTKRPTMISWFDKEDDFVVLWQKLEQMHHDLRMLATIDKSLHTVREID